MISLHQLYTQLRNKAQRDPNARVRDFQIITSADREGVVKLSLRCTYGSSTAQDMAATVLAWYSDNAKETGPNISKLHLLSVEDFWRPIQRVYGRNLITIDYVP